MRGGEEKVAKKCITGCRAGLISRLVQIWASQYAHNTLFSESEQFREISATNFFVSVKNNYRRVRFRPEMLRQQIMFSMTIAERLFDNNDLLTSFCESKQKRLISTISYNFEDTRNLMNNSGAQKM